jgi:ribosomal protein S18 acetylase RimI-like enzyme
MDPSKGQLLTDIELFEVAVEMSMDDRRRLDGVCGIVIATTGNESRLYIGSEVLDALVPVLADAFDKAPMPSSLTLEPAAISAVRELLAPACSPLSLNASLYYVVESPLRVEIRTCIVRSDSSEAQSLTNLNPGNWAKGEWQELVDGDLGPWAMALVDGRVVSICHTPRPMSDRAAECGVWTHPDYRGRGYASEVTAVWADILRPSGRYLFYSTLPENLASQRVADRLQLRPIGRTWNLLSPKPDVANQRHPLSRSGA